MIRDVEDGDCAMWMKCRLSPFPPFRQLTLCLLHLHLLNILSLFLRTKRKKKKKRHFSIELATGGFPYFSDWFNPSILLQRSRWIKYINDKGATVRPLVDP